MSVILSATGVPSLDNLFLHEKFAPVVTSIYIIEEREAVLSSLDRLSEAGGLPDVLFLSEALPGKMYMLDVISRIRLSHPEVRVVYITSEIKLNERARLQNLNFLITLGVYDIVSPEKISPKHIYRAITSQGTRASVQWIIDANEKNAKESESNVNYVEVEEVDQDEDEEDDGISKNVTVFSSIKPGSGKSFISANIATAIARYGARKEDGERPKVALIDADLQNLSLGTLLQIPDEKNNLRSVMDKIHEVFGEDGYLTDSVEVIDDAQRFIKKSFTPFIKEKNLHVLAGSQLMMDQVQDITSNDFLFLVRSIEEEYDVIIIDSNSSLTHVSTTPLFLMAKDIYYIINLDFNNIRNTSRYFQTLEDLQVVDKVKYILNENITEEYMERHSFSEPLKYTENHVRESGFDLVGSVPIVDKTVFLNHIYDGTPLVMDNEDYTLEGRLELSRIANKIWPIEKLPYMEAQYEKQRESKPKKKRLFG